MTTPNLSPFKLIMGDKISAMHIYDRINNITKYQYTNTNKCHFRSKATRFHMSLTTKYQYMLLWLFVICYMTPRNLICERLRRSYWPSQHHNSITVSLCDCLSKPRAKRSVVADCACRQIPISSVVMCLLVPCCSNHFNIGY